MAIEIIIDGNVSELADDVRGQMAENNFFWTVLGRKKCGRPRQSWNEEVKKVLDRGDQNLK